MKQLIVLLLESQGKGRSMPKHKLQVSGETDTFYDTDLAILKQVALLPMAVSAQATLAVWLDGWLRDRRFGQWRFGGCVFLSETGSMLRRWQRSSVAEWRVRPLR